MISRFAADVPGVLLSRWITLLLVALSPSWAVSQDEPNAGNTGLSTQVTSMALPTNAQAGLRVAASAATIRKTVSLGTPTDRPNQSSRSGVAAIGMVYTANPDLHEVVPGDSVSFEALDGEIFGFEVIESRVTRHGNVEISAREGDTSLFAVVAETGDFFADILVESNTYRAFISEDQTIVFSSDDPQISKGTVTNDTPFDDLNDLSAQYTASTRAAQPLTPQTGSDTAIALGILLDNYFWANQTVALAKIDYYVANLNSAYQQAGVDIRFEVSKIGNYEPYQDAYATSGDLSPTLKWITCGSTDCQPTSGVNTAVDSWRIANKLDVVTQFLRYAAVTTPDAQGQYSINWGIAQLPFSDVAIRNPSILKQYTYSVNGLYNPYNGVSAGAYLLAHEIGHNFGLWHDRETLEGQLGYSWPNLQPVLEPIMRYPYGIGYRFGQSSGTTMSYAPTNVNLLSTPNVLSGGIPIGVPVGQSSQAFSAQAVGNVMSFYKAVFNNAPSAPTITKVEADYEQILVTFAPGATGGLAVTGYTATCTDGQSSFQGTGTSSPISVKGVSNNVSYTCTVVATNPDGASAPSGSSASVTLEEAAGFLPVWLLYLATQQQEQEPISQLGAAINEAVAGDYFGWPLDLSSDGQYLAIGRGTKVIGAKPGSVQVFEWSNEVWQQRGSTLLGEEVDDFFGEYLAISDDGNRLVAGAYANDGGGANAGSVRVFEYINGDWTQLGQDIDGEAASDFSGPVAMSGDGAMIAVGAPGNDDGSLDEFRNIGKVRVYRYDGGVWLQAGQDITGEADYDQCCPGLALSSDGGVLAVGTSFNDGNGDRAGHVRVFQWDGAGWSQVGADIDGEASMDLSGMKIALSSDGMTVAIGAELNDGNGNEAGHVRVFRWDGVNWSQRGSDIDGEAAGDYLSQVALSGDGSTLLVGASGSAIRGDDFGDIRLFRYVNSDWIQVGINILGAVGYDERGPGFAISADGARLAVGSRFADGNGQDSGQVKVFQINTGE